MIFIKIMDTQSQLQVYQDNTLLNSPKITDFLTQNDISLWFLPFHIDSFVWKGLTAEIHDILQTDQEINYIFEGDSQKTNKFYAQLHHHIDLMQDDLAESPAENASYNFYVGQHKEESGNPVSATLHYTLAANMGFVPAILALMKKAKREFKNSEQFKWSYQGAIRGNADAQYNLSRCYWLGWGTPKNSKMALEWIKAAATQGHVESQYQLGNLYKEGKDVPLDVTIAFEWYLKAAKQHYYNAEMDLAECYTLGIGVEKNPKKAFEWYMKATDHNLGNAFLKVSHCYTHGAGVKADPDAALEWLIRSAAVGNIDATHQVALSPITEIVPINNEIHTYHYNENDDDDDYYYDEYNDNELLG